MYQIAEFFAWMAVGCIAAQTALLFEINRRAPWPYRDKVYAIVSAIHVAATGGAFFSAIFALFFGIVYLASRF